MNRRVYQAVVAAAGVVAVATVPGVAAAQEVVQQLPSAAQETLSDALRRLSRNPESVPALVAAGRASLDLDDVSAAQSFFTRAQAVDPDDGRVLSGLALVAVRRGEPVTALQLFENAEAAGESLSPHAAEQGLAYDLVGRNDRAQRLYRQALSRQPSDEVLRRLALSYAMAGNADASEATLLPLLQRQDRAAYRTRAFALAIQGRGEEAIAIAETMLPPRLSQRLAPYFRYMPQLTRAQQAAAANLGRFPSANEVGRDTPAIAALSAGAELTMATRRQSAADRLRPQGTPLGGNEQPDPTSTPAQPQQVALAEVPATTAPPVAPAPSSGELPPVPVPVTSPAPEGAAAPAPQPEPEPQPEPVTQPAPAAIANLGDDPQFTPAEDARPSFSLTDVAGSTLPGAPSAVEPAQEPEPEPLDLADAFADFTLESTTMPTNRDAVDITTIDPPREVPAPVVPPPPAHPARYWVQVATGQDTGAFRFDWRRIVRNAGGLLDGKDAYSAPWGQTNRLLTGPFASEREAQAFVSQLAGAGVDAFRFNSQEGQEISRLD